MSKLILTNEVQGLGSAGDIVEVKNGYARNFLIPIGLAVIWSRGGEKQVTQISDPRDAHAIASEEEALAIKSKLEGALITIKSKRALTAACSAQSRLLTWLMPFRPLVSARLTSVRSSSHLQSAPPVTMRQAFV